MTEPTERAVAIVACAGCIPFAGLDFQPANVLIGVGAALLVRVPLFKFKGRISAEISFILIAMLGTFAMIVNYRLASGPSFWCGIVFGSISSSLYEIGRSMARSAVKDRLQAAARILFGIKTP